MFEEKKIKKTKTDHWSEAPINSATRHNTYQIERGRVKQAELAHYKN